MSVVATVPKDPLAVLPFAIDWAAIMPEGWTLTDAVWEVRPAFELTVDSSSHDGKVATA